MKKTEGQQAFEEEFLEGFMSEFVRAVQLRPRKANTEAFLTCLRAADNDEAAIPCVRMHVEDFLRSLGFLQRWGYRIFIVPRIPWQEMARRCRYHVLTEVEE